MKNNMAKKAMRSFVFKIGIWTMFLFGFFFVFLIVGSWIDLTWLYRLSPDIYHFLGDIYSFFTQSEIILLLVPLIWIVGVFVLVYQLVKKVFSYLQALSLATADLMDKSKDYITLPDELIDLQNEMNSLKKTSIFNEMKAKESEQKKNDLVVYLAHDLKTPLTSMVGYLSLLAEAEDMPEKQRIKYIQIALDKSYKLEELLNELFDITRFNSEAIVLEKETIQLKMMMEQIIDDFYPVLIEENRVIHLFCKQQVSIKGDSEKLARVFNNLVKNAIYYSTEPDINIEILKKDHQVDILISNEGKTIPPEKLNRLFEKFYRADFSRTSKTGGTGLGLAIAKEIVELHQGTIQASSKEGKTQFLVTLPLS